MIELSDIKTALAAGRVRVTFHAHQEADADALSLDDVFASLDGGEMLKQYPDDRPYPSCLVYGPAQNGDPVHSVWGYNGGNGWAVLITVYRPNPLLWLNWRERRPPT